MTTFLHNYTEEIQGDELTNLQKQYPNKKIKSAKRRLMNGGGLLAIGDYSQLEIYMASILSGEQKLLDALASGADIHAWTASQIFPHLKGMSASEVKKNHKKERSFAKTVSFGVLYQKNPDTEELKNVYDYFFNTFPNLKDWVDDTKRFCMQNGYVQTPFGRFRHLKDVFLKGRENVGLVNAALRRAVNTPIQSTASDCAFIACVTISEALEKMNMKSRFLGGVHDSILVDAYPGEVFKVCEVMKYATSEITHDFMKGYHLNFDLGIGHSWGRQLEIKDTWVENDRKFYKLSGGDVDFKYLKRELAIAYPEVKYEKIELGDDIEYESKVHEWVQQNKKFIDVTISIPNFEIDKETLAVK